MSQDIARYVIAGLSALTLGAAGAGTALFEADSKRLGNPKMDILVKEVERRERSSVVEVTIKSPGSSVGGSFFVLCSVRQLAQLRGNYRYIVKLDDTPGRGQMLVGFFRSADEDPLQVAPEFQGPHAPAAVLDLDQFAAICTSMK
jgi:hypothetical protein